MGGQEDKRANNRTMFAALKNNAAAGYKGSMKLELLKGADLRHFEALRRGSLFERGPDKS